MIPMNVERKQRLEEETVDLQAKLERLESYIKECRAGQHNTDIDTIHLNEEQAHYMRGYLKILKIKCYQQGIKI